MGHLAKAFALREAPKNISGVGGNSSSNKTNAKTAAKAFGKPRSAIAKDKGNQRGKDWDEAHDPDAERRMQEIVVAGTIDEERRCYDEQRDFRVPNRNWSCVGEASWITDMICHLVLLGRRHV